ncbi:phage holin [Lactococcus petauri]|uniref:Phage holin n=2 Tax=Lactococcus petauri TaxID=1940789 RepID=A0AAJ2IWG3_9LACT|nr:phage holin [Lactococcus petauri]PST73566.1 holin [Lactococcus garvieae]MDT2526369.1 phage holin [Lactococcus petauri]MDT2540914.1 phage holin [Lactococcus petauri]MDT2557488.1 phage holin [Lactococcus petauri]MDT2559437.1 phage holin [Lactococcus petauri]
MNKINWEVRLKSKTFWLAAVPAFLLLAQTIGAPFGYKWDFVVLNQQLAAIINAAFGLLAIIGVVVDPTTAGIKDSQRVMEKSEDNK